MYLYVNTCPGTIAISTTNVCEKRYAPRAILLLQKLDCCGVLLIHLHEINVVVQRL